MQTHALCDFAHKKNGITRLLQAKCCLNTTFSRSRSASALCMYSTCVYCRSVPPNRPQMTENRRGPLMKGRKSPVRLSFPFLCSSCSASGFCRKTTTGANFPADLRISIISNRSAAEYMTETITKCNQSKRKWD